MFELEISKAKMGKYAFPIGYEIETRSSDLGMKKCYVVDLSYIYNGVAPECRLSQSTNFEFVLTCDKEANVIIKEQKGLPVLLINNVIVSFHGKDGVILHKKGAVQPIADINIQQNPEGKRKFSLRVIGNEATLHFSG